MKLRSVSKAEWRKLPHRGDQAVRIDNLMVIYHRTPDAGVGMVVNKKHGNAVERNRIRRRLRAAATSVLAERSGSWIVVAQDGAGALSSADMERLLVRAVRKIDKRLAT